MPYDIGPRTTFYGKIPSGSDQEHLGIVLNSKDSLVKHCYCTSKYKKIYSDTDFVHITKEKMANYFDPPQDTYIYISNQHIIDLPLITLIVGLDSAEYGLRQPIDTDTYITIISRVQNSNNLSERFKKEFFDFLE
jgi:hypothetical protein